MRRLLILASLFLCFTLSSCQCSDKPDVGPVEDEDQASIVTPDAGLALSDAVRV